MQSLKGYSILTLVVIVVVLTFGSLNTDELNENAFVSSMGIDESKKGYKVSVQILNPAAFSKGSQSKEPFFVFQQDNKQFGITMSGLTESVSRKLNVSHVQTVIISEKLAKKFGVERVIDSLLRPTSYPNTIDILITRRNKAEDFIHVPTKIDPLPSKEISNLVKNTSGESGTAFPTYPGKIKAWMDRPGKELVIPVVELHKEKTKPKSGSGKEEESQNIALDGLSLFHKDKPVAWINRDLSKTFYLLNNQLTRAKFIAPCTKNDEFSMQILGSRTKIKGKMIKGVPVFSIHTKVTGDIIESSCEGNIQKISSAQKLEKYMEEEIKNNIEKLIQVTQKKKTDIIGFGEVLGIYEHKQWKQMQKDWYSHYKDATFNVSVDVKIENYGDVL